MKEYTGSVYVGVAGPDNEPGKCRDSIDSILLRPGDQPPSFARATKGYEARQGHINKFMGSNHAFVLLLDHDMVYPANILERLRSHKLPYISGLYMRRDIEPVVPIWFRPFGGQWPMEPWGGDIERGRLHKIGASGWGCALVHREVIEAVRVLLKGERDVIEDDMDIWPYNLPRVMAALNGLQNLVKEKPTDTTLYPALEHHVTALTEEIRPLRADNEPIGSDIRFPFYAQQAGYQFWGDPDARCGHNVDFTLHPDQYDQFTADQREQLRRGIHRRVAEDRQRLRKQLRSITYE